MYTNWRLSNDIPTPPKRHADNSQETRWHLPRDTLTPSKRNARTSQSQFRHLSHVEGRLNQTHQYTLRFLLLIMQEIIKMTGKGHWSETHECNFDTLAIWKDSPVCSSGLAMLSSWSLDIKFVDMPSSEPCDLNETFEDVLRSRSVEQREMLGLKATEQQSKAHQESEANSVDGVQKQSETLFAIVSLRILRSLDWKQQKSRAQTISRCQEDILSPEPCMWNPKFWDTRQDRFVPDPTKFGLKALMHSGCQYSSLACRNKEAIQCLEKILEHNCDLPGCRPRFSKDKKTKANSFIPPWEKSLWWTHTHTHSAKEKLRHWHKHGGIFFIHTHIVDLNCTGTWCNRCGVRTHMVKEITLRFVNYGAQTCQSNKLLHLPPKKGIPLTQRNLQSNMISVKAWRCVYPINHHQSSAS